MRLERDKSRVGAGAAAIPCVPVLRHRDVVGSVNMHQLAFGAKIAFPARITYQRAGPVRVLARDKHSCQVQSSPPVVGAPEAGYQEGVVPFALVLSRPRAV